MKTWLIALFVSVMSLPAFAGTWGAPVEISNETLVAPQTVASYTAAQGVSSTTELSGNCSATVPHYYYVATRIPRGIVWQWNVSIRKQVCS